MHTPQIDDAQGRGRNPRCDQRMLIIGLQRQGKQLRKVVQRLAQALQLLPCRFIHDQTLQLLHASQWLKAP
eukprot:1158799-Pelagomonas_calceolata.AAC.5